MIDSRGQLFKKINLIDATVGLMALLFFSHVVGYGLSVSLPLWTEPTILKVSPAKVLVGDTIRVTGRNFDPRTEIKIGDSVLQVGFITSQAISLTLPSDFLPGNYSVTARNKWKREASWKERLTVEARPEPIIAKSPVLVKRKPKPKPSVVVEGPVFPKYQPGRLPREGPYRISLLCVLRVEDMGMEPSFKWFVRNLPKEIQVLDVVPKEKRFLAQVTLPVEKHPKPGVATYYLNGREPLNKGYSFTLVNDRNFRIYGVALEDPVFLKKTDG